MIGRAVLLCLCLTTPAAACFVALPPGVVADSDGYASVTLDDGREVRLAGIVPAAMAATADPVPGLPLGALTGQRVAVRGVAGAPEADRYGRVTGDIVTEDTDGSVLEQGLREGLALVDPAGMSKACLEVLFTAERAAENARRGFWARPDGVRSAADPTLAQSAGAYALVTGVVKSVGETRSAVYLNFGESYETDFTALVRRKDAKSWDSDLAALAGTRVRVRGVLEAWNGGLIRLEHPRQVERQ